MNIKSENSESILPRRSAINQDLHVHASSVRPIISRGVAGESAMQVAKESAELKKQEPRRTGLPRSEAFTRGATGEQAIAQALNWLPGGDFWVLHDQPFPGKIKANIDHIVVGRTGIFVIDSKNWSGDVQIVEGTLRQNGQDRSAAISGVRAQATAVKLAVSGLPFADAARIKVTPALAFSRGIPEPCSVDGVLLVGAEDIAATIGAGKDSISPSEVGRVAYELEGALSKNRDFAVSQSQRNRSGRSFSQDSLDFMAELDELPMQTNHMRSVLGYGRRGYGHLGYGRRGSGRSPQPNLPSNTFSARANPTNKPKRNWIKPKPRTDRNGCVNDVPPDGNRFIEIFIVLAVLGLVICPLVISPLAGLAANSLYELISGVQSFFVDKPVSQ